MSVGRSSRARPGRCRWCGGRTAVERRGNEAMAATLAISGSVLSLYLVGLVLLAAAAWVWLRRPETEVCPTCEHDKQ